MCRDVELITRQTLTEFSGIREATSRNRQRAHLSKSKEIMFSYLTSSGNIYFILFFSNAYLEVLFEVHLVHRLLKILFKAIFLTVLVRLHAGTLLIQSGSGHVPMFVMGLRTRGKGGGGGVTDDPE